MRRGTVGGSRWWWAAALTVISGAACGGQDPGGATTSGAETSTAGSTSSASASTTTGTSTGGTGGATTSTGMGATGGAGGAGGAGGTNAGSSGAGGSGGSDAGSDAPSGDGAACGATPDPNPSWTTAYQDDIVSRLSGHADISNGTRLVNRSTVPNRQAARQYLSSLLTQMGLVPQEQNYGTGSNVYAELKGTSSASTYVVIGAHFDSVAPSPGANDNATGVAAVLATARYMTSVPCRSKHFFFVLFDEEEVGLVGSKNFAAKLKTDGTVVHSVHTIDQMGWDSNSDRLIELELPDTGLENLYRTAVGELGVSIPIKVTKTGSTDHASFRPTFLATGVTEGYTSGDTTPYYHKAGDTYETVDFAYLDSTTVLVNRVMADLSR